MYKEGGLGGCNLLNFNFEIISKSLIFVLF